MQQTQSDCNFGISAGMLTTLRLWAVVSDNRFASFFYIPTTTYHLTAPYRTFMDNLNDGEGMLTNSASTLLANTAASKATTFCQLGRTKFVPQQGSPALLHTSTEP